MNRLVLHGTVIKGRLNGVDMIRGSSFKNIDLSPKILFYSKKFKIISPI